MEGDVVDFLSSGFFKEVKNESLHGFSQRRLVAVELSHDSISEISVIEQIDKIDVNGRSLVSSHFVSLLDVWLARFTGLWVFDGESKSRVSKIGSSKRITLLFKEFEEFSGYVYRLNVFFVCNVHHGLELILI